MTSPAQPAEALPPPVFGDPTPVGLLGLAIGCGALLPIAFGWMPSDPAKLAGMFRAASWFCLLFGAGGQLLSGLMALANKHALGGTLFTTFAFNWMFNAWALREAAEGRGVDPHIALSVDVTFILIFVVLTFAFGFFSKLLFVFLLDIDLLYVLRIAKHFAPGLAAPLGLGIAFATLALGGIALYLALALLLNPAAGRTILPLPGPMFAAGARPERR